MILSRFVPSPESGSNVSIQRSQSQLCNWIKRCTDSLDCRNNLERKERVNSRDMKVVLWRKGGNELRLEASWRTAPKKLAGGSCDEELNRSSFSPGPKGIIRLHRSSIAPILHQNLCASHSYKIYPPPASSQPLTALLSSSSTHHQSTSLALSACPPSS